MTVTHPGARALIFSSAFGTLDYHYQLVEAGNTDEQIVTLATTWEASPWLTEEQTHRLEPDPKRWLREYGNVPSSAASGVFDSEEIAPAFEPLTIDPKLVAHGQRVLVCDPSSGRNDDFTAAVLSWATTKPEPEFILEPLYTLGGVVYDHRRVVGPDGKFVPNPKYQGEQPASFLHVERIIAFRGRFHERVSGDVVVSALAQIAAYFGVRHVFGDQRESLMLASAFARHGLSYFSHAWTNDNKRVAIETVRRWFGDRRIVVAKDPDGESERLRRELLSFEEKILPTGYVSFGARSAAKDDRVALLITAAIADAAGHISSSPYARTVRRVVPAHIGF